MFSAEMVVSKPSTRSESMVTRDSILVIMFMGILVMIVLMLLWRKAESCVDVLNQLLRISTGANAFSSILDSCFSIFVK